MRYSVLFLAAVICLASCAKKPSVSPVVATAVNPSVLPESPDNRLTWYLNSDCSCFFIFAGNMISPPQYIGFDPVFYPCVRYGDSIRIDSVNNYVNYRRYGPLKDSLRFSNYANGLVQYWHLH